ncbi:SpoIIE family protein phosphatase [Streptomyces sp. NPDC000229]|uniref:SpoIIE family protein phosphatase n=1 Tax=Streptomyces sp. NPDC000229 TaxID=3154247 RepID=UPI0033229188
MNTPLEQRPTTHVPLDHHSAVQVAADQARALARRCGMTGSLPEQAAVLASELASNIDKHARGGALYLQPAPLRGGVDIIAADHGPGIADIPLSLTDGYSTADTLGAGLGAVNRIATRFTIRSSPQHGTLAHAFLAQPNGAQRPHPDAGALCLSAPREADCGDGYAITRHGHTHTALVVDGLGHGPHAAEAAHQALRAFHAHAQAPLTDILHALHTALRPTRGAAAAALRMHANRAEYCGIGNIRATAHSVHGIHSQHTGQAGILGHHAPAPRVQHVDLHDATSLIVHTDGIDHRWTHTPSAAQLHLPPSLLATHLAHTHRRYRDDATVLVFGAL